MSPLAKRVLLASTVLITGLLLATEAAGRINYFSRHGMPFFSPARDVLYRFYPNLRDVPRAGRADEPPDAVRILMLDGSTLSPGFSPVGERLEQGLAEWLQRPVRVYNLSAPAQSSLDSWYKYWALRDRSFDLVIVYDGINDLRANNVPDALWRDDYSHYAWYREVNFLVRHHDWTRFGWILPFYLQHKLVALDRKTFNHGQKVPYNSELSRPEWMGYGASIKTVAPFRDHFERLLDLARQKHEPVLLMTFAWFIPEGYTETRFNRGELPYVQQGKGTPLQLWGTPENMTAGLQAHNGIIRDLAASRHTLFVDQERFFSGHPDYFQDVCHFTDAGAEAFAAHLLDELNAQAKAGDFS